MPHHIPPSPSTFSSPRYHSQLFTIVLIVIAIHLVLLGLGTFWNPAPPAPKPRSKIIVQTVRLKPFESAVVQMPASTPTVQPVAAPMPTLHSPIEPPKIEPPAISQPLKEETSPQPDISLEKEEAFPIQEVPIKKEESQVVASMQEAAPISTPTIPPPLPVFPPLPIKTENKPQPKAPSPKPMLQETPKTTNKTSAPVKKPIEAAKKPPKTEATKSKLKEEAEKKQQREQAEAEKKRQKERAEAEKKRQQEIAEAEKKRQQEIAEAEKKRQQEIAAAQEAARQKEQALLAKAKETLAKMGETRDKMSSSSSSVNLEAAALPQELGVLQVDALPWGETGSSGEWGTKEISYSDEVAYRLKMALRFPDYGAVKIKLTLDRTGRIVKVETVQSESSKNKAYVESKIPTLLFPSFGQRFQGVQQNTFVITLQNDS